MKKKQLQIESLKKEKADIIKIQMEKVQLLKEQKLENDEDSYKVSCKDIKK